MKTSWRLAGVKELRMGPIGVQEMIAIFVVALILFGPKKLPELARTLGKALSEFRRAKNELKSSFETHLRELERETQFTQSSSTEYTPARYPHPYEDYSRSNIDYSASAPYEPEPRTPEALPAASEQADAAVQLSSSEASPVTGTVPRSNGFHAGEPVTAIANEKAAATTASSEQERTL